MAYPETSPILDFTIVDTHNVLTIAIADISFYPSNFAVTNPTYEITPPSFVKATVSFNEGEVLFLNSNTLNITCVSTAELLTALPDGIWKIKQSIAPAIDFNTEKSFLRTTNIEQKFGKAFLKTDLIECNQDVKIEQMKVLDEIYFYIQAAISAANQCNYILAMKLYGYANTMLDNFIRGTCRGTTNTLWC
jgi:hypothetical protein